MSFLTDLRFAGGSTVLQSLIPTILLATTQKQSIIRYLAILCMVWIASQNVRQMNRFCGLSTFITGQTFLNIPQAANLLLINPLDADDLAREEPGRTKTFTGRMCYSFELLCQNRGVGTPRQVKGIPSYPAYYRYTKKAGITLVPRCAFLLRQLAILTWQYAVCDIIQFVGRQRASGPTAVVFTEPEWNVPLGEWIERCIMHSISWFLISRVFIDSRYRLVSIVTVGLGMNSPLDWPPLFGRIADAYTLRQFWGTFWHQLLRQPFTAISNWIARDIMHLPRPSVLERYTNICLVFLQSGLLHVLLDAVVGMPTRYSGALPFFTSFTLGIMIEDGIQELYKRMTGSEGHIVPRWKRAVGHLWVIIWLGVTSTWYLRPISQNTPPHELSIVPFSISDRVGLTPVVGFTAVSGLALISRFGIEI
ncbi:hypothetical protein N7474_001129 [Penicillium riverlandense]|uniref:uncharacterized protein n=1 Tax=Penicillium riverlandense TaxID=1903569 RepID=UPI00254785F4|nr:uncharacterized protein N7474_001129 [Penicillium riverlandense]KAJ5832818.1 hypothetical protein N7474_001129 [Penicillium riverlandense]